MNFAQVLEDFLKEKRLTQKELATRAGRTPGYINHLLKGSRTAPSEETVQALGDALELDAKNLARLFDAAGYSSPLTFARAHTRIDKVDWGDSPNVQMFYGREEELKILEQWIIQDKCQLVCLLGMGGIGKTMLAAKSLEMLQSSFDYIFWRSLKPFPTVESLLKELLSFFAVQRR